MTAQRVETRLFALDLDPAALADAEALLDRDERIRAGSYRDDLHRDRFVARRGQLRANLGAILGVDAAALRIAADDHGKPFLPDHPDLAFNLSHSRGMALCAVGRGVRLGCDIEWRDPAAACPAVAARFFAPAEQAALAALPADAWLAAFFNAWTRKEAYVKALGLGLSYPLDAFAVSVAPGQPARLLDAPPGWRLASFEPAPGYQAALAIGPAA